MHQPMLIVGAALCVVAGLGLFTEHVSQQHAQAAALRTEAEYAEGQILPRTPSETLRGLHSMISYAANGPAVDLACSLMTPLAQQQFAAVHQQPDCPAVARVLGTQVTDHARYPRFRFTAQDEVILGDHGSMDGCAITWRGAIDPPDLPNPGPMLGKFSMHRVAGLGFKITGITPCPPTAPATTPRLSPSSTPSLSTGPVNSPQPNMPTPRSLAGLLPSYAPSVPAILAGRIATNDPSTCALFTDTARAQFTTAHQSTACPTAVNTLHIQVSDSQVYSNPRNPPTTPGLAGVVIDACHLTWSTWAGPAHPGPQIGRLTLQHPPRHAGYLIANYQPC